MRIPIAPLFAAVVAAGATAGVAAAGHDHGAGHGGYSIGLCCDLPYDDVQWLRVDVDPSTRGVFSFPPQIIPAIAGS